MSIANIGLQNVALERLPCDSDAEIKKCRNMSELRNKPEIIDDWQTSINPLMDTLKSRFSRLKLEDSPFKVLPAATDSEREDFIEKAAVIDPVLPSMIRSGRLQKKKLEPVDGYQNFKSTHCHEGVYAFQIRKCGDIQCCGVNYSEIKPHWLPFPIVADDNPEHYKPFSKVYGTEPTEEYLPSNVNNAKKVNDLQQAIATSKLTAQNVRSIVKCTSCQKPRCIYVIRAFSQREMIELKQVLEKFPYVYGCLLAPDSSFIDGHVFTRLAMHCNTPIEWAYYGAVKISLPKDLCSHCGNSSSKVDTEQKKLFKCTRKKGNDKGPCSNSEGGTREKRSKIKSKTIKSISLFVSS